MKIEYLKMIQRVIERFSIQSSKIKTWCITLITAMTSFSLSSPNIEINILLILVLFITTVFLLMDTYYLQLERSYRKLYSIARLLDEEKIDFCMDFKSKDMIFEQFEGKQLMVSQVSCLFSKSIYLFYSPIFIVLLLIVFIAQ
ncbi:MAG: hypothetical protein NUK62_08050 [Tenericutes bacterium]|nr:hypothetical protein [Mycoplasmatota bacterium]